MCPYLFMPQGFAFHKQMHSLLHVRLLQSPCLLPSLRVGLPDGEQCLCVPALGARLLHTCSHR